MTTKDSVALRLQLVDAMRGHQAHIEFDSALEDFVAEARGLKPQGAPHTAWQLLEHMRIAQNDILEFSRNPKHRSPEWPEGYWPKTEAPPDPNAWDASVKAFKNDAREFNKLIQDLQEDLFKPFEHGDGQNLLREALLVASHNSYHLGQLMFVKKMVLAKIR
jgi:DinB superfamily